jgi:ribosomal protein S18 acetylase RimI-like enzyme
MEITKADINDIEAILTVQMSAYQREAELHDNFDIPPLKETVADVKEVFKDTIVLKAVDSGEIVGSVRGKEKDGTCYIGRLAVLPERQKQGIGTALLNAIEEFFPGCRRMELFTALKSEHNIRLYQKCGYVQFKRGGQDCGVDIEVVFLEKTK